jgi:hypothetical protein
MSGKWKSWAAGGVVGGMLIYMGPDAVRDFASRSRQTVTPVFEEGVGAAGDGVNAIRKEANRQGINPGAVFSSTPTTEPGSGPRQGFGSQGDEVGN